MVLAAAMLFAPLLLAASPPREAGAAEPAAAAAARAASSPLEVDASGKDAIEITTAAASWDNLSELFLGNTPAAPFGEGSMFVMRGELKNNGTRSVHHVVLRYELLDEQGRVLEDSEGFNRSAEGMRPDEEGKLHEDTVKPVPAGGIDSYRMVFFSDEVPRFAKQRVRVVEVHEDAAAAPSPKEKGNAGK